MGFEISGMTDAKTRSWATKCDANSDGKIDERESSIFNEGKENMHDWGTTVGGVTFYIDQVKTIQRNQNGDKFDYSVRFSNGMRMQFDEQAEGNEANVFTGQMMNSNGNVFNCSYFMNITDGDGFSVKGSRLNDDFAIYNSTIDMVDGFSGRDSVYINGSIGNNNSGQIFAEEGLVRNSSDLSIKKNSQKILRPKDKLFEEQVSDKNPDVSW